MSKKIDTRESILAVSQRLFSHYGYAGTSMSVIAAEVGINKSSLYYFFKNKQQIYITIISNILERVREEYSVDPSKNPSKILKEILLSTLTLGVENGAILSVKDKSILSEKTEELKKLTNLAKEVEDTIVIFMKKAGTSNPKLATQVVMDSLQGYIFRSKEKGCVPNKNDFVNYLSKIII